MASHKRHRKRRPARGPARRNPRRRLLVVCEGKVTEPRYIDGFVRKSRNATVEVRVHDEHGDPRKLVELAKSKRQEARAEARRQGDDFLAYDEVWCVFDRDEHDRFNDACQMALDNQLDLAASNPCFELWLLLHFRASPGAQHRHHVQKMLKKFLPGYDKHLDFADVAGGIHDATDRARLLDQDAERLGERFRNPSTGFYQLTGSIARTDPPRPGTASLPARASQAKGRGRE